MSENTIKLRAFIVEDDPSFLQILSIRLKAWKKEIEITSAKTIAESRTVLDNITEAFDLVILDQHLPDGMGPDLFVHEAIQDSAVLAVSAEDSPELPANALKAGAMHFLSKRQISERLFLPLLDAIIERKRLVTRIKENELRASRLKTIRTLVRTLMHEINNPLGAMLGGTFLLKSGAALSTEQKEALKTIDESSLRIKHVLEQLSKVAELETVDKGSEELFQVPGDKKWS